MSEQSGQVDLSVCQVGDECHQRNGDTEIFRGQTPPNKGDRYSADFPFETESDEQYRRDGSFGVVAGIESSFDIIRVTRNGVQITPSVRAMKEQGTDLLTMAQCIINEPEPEPTDWDDDGSPGSNVAIDVCLWRYAVEMARDVVSRAAQPAATGEGELSAEERLKDTQAAHEELYRHVSQCHDWLNGRGVPTGMPLLERLKIALPSAPPSPAETWTQKELDEVKTEGQKLFDEIAPLFGQAPSPAETAGDHIADVSKMVANSPSPPQQKPLEITQDDINRRVRFRDGRFGRITRVRKWSANRSVTVTFDVPRDMQRAVELRSDGLCDYGDVNVDDVVELLAFAQVNAAGGKEQVG